jgi:hypothetical protein
MSYIARSGRVVSPYLAAPANDDVVGAFDDTMLDAVIQPDARSDTSSALLALIAEDAAPSRAPYASQTIIRVAASSPRAVEYRGKTSPV